jgi:hypothetical protein
MVFAREIDVARRLVIVRPDSAPTIEDWTDLLDRLARDPDFQPGFGIISDRRLLEGTPTVEYVRASVEAIAERGHLFGKSRWAIVTSRPATYGMARMAQAYAENRGIAFTAFADLDEAIAWTRGS